MVSGFAEGQAALYPAVRELRGPAFWGYEPESCEQRGRCSLQYVVEADGSVYPCDFYVLDRYRMGNFLENTVEELEQRGRESGFIAGFPEPDEGVPGLPLTFVSPGAAAAGTGKSGRTGALGEELFLPGLQAIF